MDPKVYLRNVALTDAQDMARLANNIKIWNNVRNLLPHPYHLKDAKNFISIVAKQDPVQNKAIVFEDQFVGMCGAHPRTDVYEKTAEVGFWIGEPFWNKGIGTKVCELLVEYGFNTLGMQRLEAEVFAFNLSSMRVLEKNGFVKEGILRSRVYKNGQIVDAHMYGLVREGSF